MRSFFVLLVVLSFICIPNSFGEDVCLKWFQTEKIKPGKDCLLKCASTSTDMSTFDCPGDCDRLCKAPFKEKFLFQISDLYPGLTPEERALSSKYPTKMLKAYQLSWKAEEVCLTLYISTETNDESDACRHFVWAALLTNEFESDLSGKILNAHEQDPKQPEQEKSMDLANNRLGQIVAQKLIKQKTFNEDNILNEFKENLKQGRLIILRKPKGKLP